MDSIDIHVLHLKKYLIFFNLPKYYSYSVCFITEFLLKMGVQCFKCQGCSTPL